MYDYELSGYGRPAPWHDAGEMIYTAVLPEGLTSIGDYAFCGCCGMQEVTIPESVRSIGEGAFRACSLRTLTIPKNVTTIGKDAFYGGGVLESFSVHPENPCFSADEAGALYNREQTVLIDVPTGKRGTFAIPDSVKTIGDGAFEHCYELSAVTIPEGLTSIGCYAFTDCIGLTSVTIPDGVTSIGEMAFIYCYELRAATIPASVTEIGENAFQYCEALTIRGTAGSEAERYANENGIPFEALSEALYRDALAEAHTTFPAIQDRTNNLKLACAAIDGTVLMPGKTFSFNDVVGQLTEEKGYLPAIDYVSGGESASEVGGGVSQVASSLYYAVLQADLATVERSPHTYPVDYVPMGMDAAVSWDSQDFRFENTSPYPVKLEASVSDGMVHIVLRGTEWKDYSVSLSYEILETTEWETVEKEVPNDGTYQNGEVLTTPLTGYKIATYRTARSVETGSKLETTEIAVSRYEKRDKVIAKVVGT